MGLLTLLTGKDKITRQLEKLDAELGAKFFTIAANNATEFNLHNGEEVAAASAGMSYGAAVNQFITHYVRTKLDLHPKWTTEGNFKDEAHALLSYSSINFRILWRSNLEPEQKIQCVKLVTTAHEGAPDFEGLIMNMFKCAELERLVKFYPSETAEGLGIMVAMHKDLSLKSSHEFPHDTYSEFLRNLGMSYCK